MFWPWELVPGESASCWDTGRKGPVLPGCPQKPAFFEHLWDHQDLMILRRPSSSLAPWYLYSQTSQRWPREGCSQAAAGLEHGAASHLTPGMCPASRMELGLGAAFPNPGLFSSLIYQSSLGASWAPSVPPAKEYFLPTSKRSLCTSFPVVISCAGPAWVRSSAPCP